MSFNSLLWHSPSPTPKPQALPRAPGSASPGTPDALPSIVRNHGPVRVEGGGTMFLSKDGQLLQTSKGLFQVRRLSETVGVVRGGRILFKPYSSSKRPSVLFFTLFTLCPVVFQISKVKSGTPINTVWVLQNFQSFSANPMCVVLFF